MNVKTKNTALTVNINKALPKQAPVKRSAAPDTVRASSLGYYLSRKNLYGRVGPLTVVLKKDGYFRRMKALPKRVCNPMGPAQVVTADKNEIRRGLYLAPIHN